MASSAVHLVVSSKQEAVIETESVTDAQQDRVKDDGLAADNGVAASRSPLLTIDLNFELPLTDEQYVTRVITPLVKSTNRRNGAWKLSRRTRRYIPRNKSRSRKKGKQKAVASQPEPQCSTEVTTPTTKAEFLSLPGEVRNLIYSYLFEGARVFINQNPAFKCSINLSLAIRSTCKTIHAETSKPLFDSLTIALSNSSLKSKSNKHIGSSIPDHVLDELQSLEIMVPQHGGNGATAAAPTLMHMPKLQRLKFIEVDSDTSSFVETDWNMIKQTQKVTSVIQKPGENLHHWLGQLGARQDRSFQLTYELEFWTTSVQERAAHMGNLQKTSYHTILFTCSEKNGGGGGGDAKVSRLDLEQFQRRYEGYCRMEKDSVRIAQGSHANKVLQKLEDMRYHAALDKMESGIAKLKAPKVGQE